MRPKFQIGAKVQLKDGRYRIPATVTESCESWQGIGAKPWHGICYTIVLDGGGQTIEDVREEKLIPGSRRNDLPPFDMSCGSFGAPNGSAAQ